MSECLEIFTDGEVRCDGARAGEIIFDSAASRMGKQGRWFLDDPDERLEELLSEAEDRAYENESRADRAEGKIDEAKQALRRSDISDTAKVALLKEALGLC